MKNCLFVLLFFSHQNDRANKRQCHSKPSPCFPFFHPSRDALPKQRASSQNIWQWINQLNFSAGRFTYLWNIHMSHDTHSAHNQLTFGGKSKKRGKKTNGKWLKLIFNCTTLPLIECVLGASELPLFADSGGRSYRSI